MAGFDIDKLMADPMFAAGVGLLGGASEQTRPLLTAYDMLRTQQQDKARTRQQEYQRGQDEMLMGIRQRQLGQQDRQLDLTAAENANQAAYRDAQTAHQNALIRKTEEELAFKRQQEIDRQKRIQWLQQNLPSLLKGQMPQGGMMPQVGTDDVQPGGGPVGKYGTPVAILDNLQKVESNGNPFAIGPDIGKGVRAKGPYQFLDSTREMLRGEIGDFSPFDPVASRDAADFYLQKLLKQNGGDWSRTLAQYGGFKTQDGSSYVNRVLTGSPESVVRQRTQNNNNPATTATPQGPSYLPSIKLDMEKGDVDITLNPSYEPEKIGIERERLGLAKNQDLRETLKARREEEEHPGKLAGQAATNKRTAVETRKTEDEIAAAERKAAEEKAMAKNAHGAIAEAMDAATAQIDSLITDPGLPRITGTAAITNRFAIPGQPAYQALAKLKSIQSKLIQDTLQATRAASKNGASGYGQFTEKELEVVKTYLDNLDPGRKDFVQSLELVKQRLAQIKSRQEEFYRSSAGAPAVGTSKGGYRFKGGDPARKENWEKE